VSDDVADVIAVHVVAERAPLAPARVEVTALLPETEKKFLLQVSEILVAEAVLAPEFDGLEVRTRLAVGVKLVHGLEVEQELNGFRVAAAGLLWPGDPAKNPMPATPA